MKLLNELMTLRENEHEERRRKDGKLKERLKILDQNIKMFSAPLYDNNKGVQRQLEELKKWRQLFIDFYDGKIGSQDVPYGAWELTTGIPDWGTRGT